MGAIIGQAGVRSARNHGQVVGEDTRVAELADRLQLTPGKDFVTEDHVVPLGFTVLPREAGADKKITVEGVGAAFTSHAESGASKGVKAHFKMDESGLLSIDTVR